MRSVQGAGECVALPNLLRSSVEHQEAFLPVMKVGEDSD